MSSFLKEQQSESFSKMNKMSIKCINCLHIVRLLHHCVILFGSRGDRRLWSLDYCPPHGCAVTTKTHLQLDMIYNDNSARAHTVYTLAKFVLPLRPKLIMISASPSMMRVKVSGVTSLHTLKALKKASLMTSSSRSGV